MTISIYTQPELTIKKYSVKQAYEYAATLIRSAKGPTVTPSTPVYPTGTYDCKATELTLTLPQFGELVEAIFFEFI